MSQNALDPLDGGYSALDLLTTLAQQTGASLCDLPDGAILWESYARRGYGYNPATWADVTDPYSAVGYIWADVYEATEAAPHAVQIPHYAVQWAPVWRNTTQTVVNSVTLTYGNNGQNTVTETDANSVTTYGLRAQNVSTELHHESDATARAEAIIRADRKSTRLNSSH